MSNPSKIKFTKEIKIAAIAAVKHPSILKPRTNFETIISEKPLTKKRNNPKVITVIGRVKKIITGRMKELTRARTTAVNRAEIKFSTLNSRVKWPTKYMANAIAINLIIRIFMVIIY